MIRVLTLSMILVGCQTTKEPMVQTECLDVGSPQGVITLCAMPAGVLCFIQNGKLINCLQQADPILRAGN